MAAIVNSTEAVDKFGKEEGSGVRCGPGYDNSPYCSGNWRTLKAGYLYKRRRGHEAWAKRWVIVQVGRILWTTKDTMPPKGASTIWYAKVTKSEKEKMTSNSFRKVLSFHRSTKQFGKKSMAIMSGAGSTIAGAGSRISTALVGTGSSPTIGSRKQSIENVLANSTSIKEALDEQDSDEEEEVSGAAGGGEEVTRQISEDDAFFVEGDEDEGGPRCSILDPDEAPPMLGELRGDSEGGGAASEGSINTTGSGTTGSGSRRDSDDVSEVDEKVERASTIDPSTVEWKLEEMIWIRREFDGMGMDQATYHLLAGAMHWKKRFGRLDADEGSEDPSPKIVIYRDQKWPTVVKGVIGLKNATVSMSDKKTIRKRFRFTIHQEDGSTTDIATDSEEERLVWIARLKEIGVHHKAPDMLREIRSASVENLAGAGAGEKRVSMPPRSSDAPSEPEEAAVASGGDVNEYGRVNSSVMNADWMNEPDEILEEISDEEEVEDEPEHVFPLTVEFHQRDGKDHRRLLLAADSPFEQEDWLRCLSEAVNPPADPYHSHVKPTSTFFAGNNQPKPGAANGALFFAGGGIVNAGASSGHVEIRPHWED
mmetsp:Transcript_19374/g.50847  ORF Transcript_19374/g.50847 Transcript_19374/m.50847 type:complete len:594 (-) Transcript_19374:440-2221(-)|eukprot:CAMPEP_0119509126 /NCGR_PEP_ID=MMETSP1344-20130328/28521_1 /TAXON_ID=236787 /ORGANISM="Florenciella parvula, Strain CCMP2471" /LENGTH=593 /DNA_ID=CAMNT_0007545935 /DNA_START=296 /DNA_END=2077 /DNA_ORIENTATION=-